MEWFIPEWLVALSTTLFIVDIFLMTEILSWGGVLSLAAWLTWRIDAPWKWSVLVFIGSFVAFAMLYVFLLRNTIGRMVRKFMQGKAPDEAIHAIVKKVGMVHIIDNRLFVSVDGELWPISSSCGVFLEGDMVKILSLQEGEVFVAPL